MGVRCGQLLHDGESPVGGAVVDQKKLVITAHLCEYAGDFAVKQRKRFLFVVAWYDK